MRTNPVAAADLRASFGDTGALRAHALLLGVLAAVLYAWWPRSDLAWHLRTATPPQTFTAVAVALFLLAGWVNARAGAGDEQAGETRLADLVAHTPVTVAAVLAGRLVAGLLAALFQVLLGLPFLLAALGVSGISASVLPGVLALVAAAAMAWRAAGLALRLVLPSHGALRDVLLFASSAAWLAATYVAAPVVNPLAAIVEAAGGGGRRQNALGVALPLYVVSGIIALAVLAAATIVAAAALRAARKAAAGETHGGRARAEYLHGLKRVARRARRAVVLRRLVSAALAGLGAGLAYLGVRPFLPAAFTLGHPWWYPVLLLGLALIAGAVVAFAVRLDRAALAVQVDRSLGTRGLASAALEIAEGRRSSAFADALLEDASSALRERRAPAHHRPAAPPPPAVDARGRRAGAHRRLPAVHPSRSLPRPAARRPVDRRPGRRAGGIGPEARGRGGAAGPAGGPRAVARARAAREGPGDAGRARRGAVPAARRDGASGRPGIRADAAAVSRPLAADRHRGRRRIGHRGRGRRAGARLGRGRSRGGKAWRRSIPRPCRPRPASSRRRSTCSAS